MNLFFLLNVFLISCVVNIASPASTIIQIEKAKDLKKTIAVKTNLLILYGAGSKNSEVVSVKNLLKSVDGSFAFVDCTNKDLKKLCKKALPEGSTYVLKHYKDGAFNKDYDRQMTKNSLQTFMRDPTGDIPFEEDPAGKDVVHLLDNAVSVSHSFLSFFSAALFLVTVGCHSHMFIATLRFFLFSATREAHAQGEKCFNNVLYELVR